MAKCLIAIIIVSAGFGCSKQALPVELAKICAADNEKKYVVTSGYLSDRGSIFCSNIGGGRMNCGLDVAASAGGPKVFGADIEQGSGANKIAKLESGYKKEDIKVLDNAGNQINFADQVKFTGQMSITPDGSVCFMTVDKIEK